MEEKKERKKKARKNNFALQHWEAFEDLSMQILDDIYKEKPKKLSRLTPRKSDGGYDGFLCFSHDASDATELYKVLLEAKLRSNSNHDLPLSDFAKTVIIAINTVSDKVYISTNAYFSAETIRRLMRYQNQTGLDIRTLDIRFINTWLKEHPKETEKFRDKELIQNLVATSFPPNIAQQKLTPDLREDDTPGASKLICDAQEQEISRLRKLLKETHGVVCVQAAMGGGKSVFIERLATTLQQSYRKIARLDLTQFSNIRSVFINLLSVAWGESPNRIFDMTSKDLKAITEYLGDKQFPERSRRALINMIHQPQEKFDANEMLHSELLLSYLKEIVPPVLKRVSVLILVSNVKDATTNALNFLCGFIKILQNQPISFLVEMELQDKNCDNFLTELEQTRSYIETISLPEWDSPTAHCFLKEKMPELEAEDRDKLIQYFGLLPLALSAGIELFKKSDVGHILLLLKTELPDCLIARTQLTKSCIDHVLKNFAVTSGENIQCSLVLLGLFEGTAKKEMLEEIAYALDLPSPISTLCMCSFLRDTGEEIQVSHGAYIASINKRTFISPGLLYRCLEAIEPKLENYFQDEEYILAKRFEIFCISRRFNQLKNIWSDLAKLYLHREETQLAYQVMKTIHEWWMQNPRENHLEDQELYWLLFHLVQASYSIHGADAKDIPCCLEQLDAVINLAAEETWPEGQSGLQYAKAHILDLKSTIALGRADYAQMLSYAEQGIALIESDNKPESLYCLAKLWANKALALKHLKNLRACVEFLEAGKNRLQKITPFLFCYYTHMGSLYSSSDFRAALGYFQKLKGCELSLSEKLHNDHNIATMYFLLGEHERTAQICSSTWISAYENHVPIEEGRTDHLLGCLEWAKANRENAYDRFFAAYQLFQRHVHRTHLWPPLVNLSTLCNEMGRTEEALFYTCKASEFLLQYHLDNINHLEPKAKGIPKIYVALLILLDHFERLDNTSPVKERLLHEITLPYLKRDYAEYVIPDRLCDLLMENGYIHNGEWMIKI